MKRELSYYQPFCFFVFLCLSLSPSQYIFGYSWSSGVQKNNLNLEHLYTEYNDITCLNLWPNSECRNVCMCVCVP